MPLTVDAFPPALPVGVTVLRGRTSLRDEAATVETVTTVSPWRQLAVRSGAGFSVRSTNCGAQGWYSDRAGYRYETVDPLTGRPWPAMPPHWRAAAQRWAAQAGYGGFDPDCCLLNLYLPGSRMGSHQDRDERDFDQPIVSVSLGLPATFVWYGATRGGRGTPIALSDGDVVVFGGAARRGYHAVRPVRPQTDGPDCRVNLTFRRAR